MVSSLAERRVNNGVVAGCAKRHGWRRICELRKIQTALVKKFII
jgi:hypothetical protein